MSTKPKKKISADEAYKQKLERTERIAQQVKESDDKRAYRYTNVDSLYKKFLKDDLSVSELYDIRDRLGKYNEAYKTYGDGSRSKWLNKFENDVNARWNALEETAKQNAQNAQNTSRSTTTQRNNPSDVLMSLANNKARYDAMNRDRRFFSTRTPEQNTTAPVLTPSRQASMLEPEVKKLETDINNYNATKRQDRFSLTNKYGQVADNLLKSRGYNSIEEMETDYDRKKTELNALKMQDLSGEYAQTQAGRNQIGAANLYRNLTDEQKNDIEATDSIWEHAKTYAFNALNRLGAGYALAYGDGIDPNAHYESRTEKMLKDKYQMSDALAQFYGENYDSVKDMINTGAQYDVFQKEAERYTQEERDLLSQYVIGKEKSNSSNVGRKAIEDSRIAYDGLKALGWSDEQIKESAKRYKVVLDTNAYNEQHQAISEAIMGSAAQTWKYNALDLGTFLPASAEGAVETVRQWTGQEYKNPYASGYNLLNMANTTEEATNERIGNPYGQFAYGAAMSTLKSFETMALGMGVGQLAGTLGIGEKAAGVLANVATLPAFGSSAYQSTLKEAADRGLGTKKATELAIANGLNEMLFEVVSFDKAYGLFKKYGGKKAKEILTKGWVDMFIQAGIEGTEEGATDLANWAADELINNTFSEYEQLVKRVGKKEADRQFRNRFLTDMGAGAVSGLFSGGATLGASAAQTRITTNDAANAVLGNETATKKLVEAALKMNKDSKAYKVASGLEDNATPTKKQVRAIIESAVKETTVREAIKDGFIESGMSEQEAERSVNNIAIAEYTGNTEDLSEQELEQYNALNEDVYEANNAAETVGRAVGYAKQERDLQNRKLNAKEVSNETKAKVDVAQENIEDKVDSDNAHDITSVASIENGVATYNLKDGSTVKNTEVVYKNDDVGLAYETSIQFGYDAQTANEVANMMSSKPRNMSASDFLIGINEAYRYGQIGYALNKANTKGFINGLTESQKQFAYKAGAEASQRSAEARASELSKATVKGTRSGKVHYASSLNGLSERQLASKTLIERMTAEVTHNDVFVYESVVKDGKRVFAQDIAGYKKGTKAPNGFYKNGVIYLDINAGNKGEGTMLWTYAHELTHFVRDWNPTKFKALGDFVISEYSKAGIPVEELVARQMQKAKDNGHSLTWDGAYEEVIADSMQQMFTDNNLAEKIAKLKQQDMTLWEKVKEWFENLAKEIAKAYKGLTMGTPEADAMLRVQKQVDRIADMFAEAVVEAGNTFERVGLTFDEGTESVAPMTSLRTWNESDYVQNVDTVAEEMSDKLGITKTKAKAYIDTINSVAKAIADDQTRLDYLGSEGVSSFVGNTEYGGSIDFSTICKKRRLLTGTFTAIQNALPNTALTAEEILTIRKMMDDKGYEVSCGLCYVEGSRAKMGEYAKEFLDKYAQTNPEYMPNMAEINTPDGLEQIRMEHPEVYEAYQKHMNSYAQRKPKLYQMATEYKGEVYNKFKKSGVEAKNKNGGLRLQSFSDFEIIHLIDCMQVIMDMSRVGLAGQAYTKVADFAAALGNTGLKINLSLIAKGVDANGKLILDEKEGMKRADAKRLRDMYSDNVGTIIVIFNDEQLKAALADDFIDYIIPFHRSQWNSKQYELMGLPANAKDYTMFQNESYINPVYNKNGKKERPSNYMPNNYWDFSKTGKENAEAYLQMCAMNNRKPKFSHLLVDNKDGSYSLQSDGSTDGYWKLLIDFKMYNNEGVGVPQMPVTPNFNMDESMRMLNEYEGGHQNFPVAQDIVDEFVNEYKDSHSNVLFSDRTTNEEVRYSIREEAPPKETLKGYKVFVVKDGKLYPPMVANPNAADTPVGVWLNADIGAQAPDSKTGRKQVKAGGKGTQGGSGSLAFRPGWHLGEIPLATQFDRANPETGVKELFPENFVWAECEIAADVDYQEEAMSYGYNKNGKFQHSLAGLPKLPVDGYYKYRTNPNPDTVPWLITGAMKVERLLGDDEVNQILAENGIAPKQRKGGNKTLADLGLSQYEGKKFSDRDSKPKSAKEQREQGYMLSEAKFRSLYSQHKIDIGGRFGDVEEQIESIKRKGFISSTSNANVVPLQDVTRFDENGKPIFNNIIHQKYAVRKGDRILLVPNTYVDTKNDIIKNGFKPFDYEIVQAEYDYQPLYEMYQKAYENSDTVKPTDNADIRYSNRDIDSWLDSLSIDDLIADLDIDFNVYENVEKAKGNKPKAKRRVDEVNKRLKQIGLRFDGTKTAAWTDEHIANALKSYASSNPNYAQAYVTYMSPIQFLNLTMGSNTATVDRIEAESASYGELDTSKLGDIYLDIEETRSGAKVIGHEGRHRMMLLGEAGFEKIPVLLFNYDNKYDKVAKDTLKLSAQKFGQNGLVSRTRDTSIVDVIPLSTGNAELISEKFGAGVDNADIRYSDRNYSYNELISKPDMVGSVISENIKMNGNKIDVSDLESRVKAKCEKIIRPKDNAEIYYLECDDIDGRIEISNTGISHGVSRGDVGDIEINNARAALALPDIIKNAIEVNKSNRRNNKDVLSESILLGVVGLQDGNSIDYYGVKILVENRSNNSKLLKSYDIVNKLYSVNAKKIDSANVSITNTIVNGTNSGRFAISIKDLIGGVNTFFNDIFSLDVYNTLGVPRSTTAKDVPYLLYSDRDVNATDNRTLLSTALLEVAQNPTEEKRIAEYQSKIDYINKQQKKIAELNKKIDELEKSGTYKDLQESKKLKIEANKAANRIDVTDKRLLELEASKPLRDVLEREKEKAYAKAKEQGEKALDNYRTKTKASVTRDKLKKARNDLEKWLKGQNTELYVPRGMVQRVIDVCVALDPTGVRQDTKVAKEFRDSREALLSLKEQYDRFDGDNENNGNVDYDYTLAYDRAFSNMIAKFAEKLGNKPIRDLSNTELEDVYEIVNEIKHMVMTARQIIGYNDRVTSYSAGQNIIDNMNAVKRKGLNKGLFTHSKAGDVLRNWMTNPMRAVQEMAGYDEDSMLIKAFNDLNDGRIKADKFKMDVSKTFEAHVNTNRKAFNEAVEKPIELGFKDLDGNDVKLTKMQMMSAILTWERETSNANRNHLDSLVLFPDATLERKGNYDGALDNGVRININDGIISQFNSKMSQWDNEYLDLARKFFRETSRDAIDSTMMQIKGRLIATEKNYFPYKVNEEYLRKESDNLKFDSTILGMGMLKSVVNNAPQGLVMQGLNGVISRHTDDVAKVYGLAIPVQNWNKIYNMKQTNKAGGRSVKQLIGTTWGVGSRKMIEQAVADLQSPRKSIVPKAVGKFKSAFVVSTLASNISVWMKQAASYPTAGAVLNGSSLTKGLGDYATANKQELFDEIDAHTPQHWTRRQGMSTAELGDANQTGGWNNFLNEKMGKAAKLNPMNWIQAMDVGTTGALWCATKREVESMGYKAGTDEYWNKVTELYNKVLEETQPMYDSLHRAEVSKNQFYSNFIMFVTQPIQNSGILREGAQKYKMARKEFGKDSAEAKASARVYRKAVTSQLASHFTFTLMTLISKALMHKMDDYRDKDKELTAESVLGEFFKQLGKNYFGAIVPVVGSIMVGVEEKMFEGNRYDVLSDPTIERVNTLIDDFGKITDPSWKNYEKLFMDVASAFGVPLPNAKNIIKGAILNGQDIINRELFEAGVERTDTQELNIAYKAYENGDAEKARKFIDKIKPDEVKGKVTSKFKKDYIEADINGDKQTKSDIEEFATFVYGAEETDAAIKRWLKDDERTDLGKEAKANKEARDKASELKADVFSAVDSGDANAIKSSINALVEDKKANGKVEKEAKSDFRSELTKRYKPIFLDAYKRKDNDEMTRIRKALKATGCYSDVVKATQDWIKESKKNK